MKLKFTSLLYIVLYTLSCVCYCRERSEILPSFTVALGALSERVVNVKDLHFLHGYNSPTLFLLYEATPTWAGSVRRGLCIECHLEVLGNCYVVLILSVW